ncbi:MAG: hypothetical protein J6R89_01975 [Clostridia bacterium]|nr:hypothetical protein [Clostridia bacterium]
MNFMGIDVGTTSVKTAVFNEKLEQLLSLNADYTLDAHGDIVEFDGEAYWEIVRGEIEKVKRDLSVDALAIDTQCETLILTDEDGKLDLGLFAHVYFIDWDHVIARRRQVNVTVMGTSEDVEDRKLNGGQVIDTRHKFTEEEKAYDIHYDLQQQR